MTTLKSFPSIADQNEKVEFDVINPEHLDMRIMVSGVLRAAGEIICDSIFSKLRNSLTSSGESVKISTLENESLSVIVLYASR